MKELEYPFDSRYIIKKKRSIRRELLENASSMIEKKIAVLGGSTTHDICAIMDLFLLNQGIKATFYESEYNQYWEDVMFDNEELKAFAPDVIYIYTGVRNIKQFPSLSQEKEEIEQMLQNEYMHYQVMWEKIEQTYHCVVIQNNFEYPSDRLLAIRTV